ncbi:uncharacterized protein [Triticum aestivum]|uniref:uncharacterized protein n=1 Tax=Triticum aestivum TaxID=4565 RepID=UPI001D00AA71|nr:uncharacterized protein LOC123162497 [Triticum aestivum]
MMERGWMYSGWTHSKSTDEWYNKTKEFIDFAFSMPSVVQNGKIKCPCAKCRNYESKNRDDVELDLCHFGFKRNYTVWTAHGEGYVEITDYVDVVEADRMDTMLNDLAARAPPIEQQPIASAQAFYRMIDSVKELVHENTSHSTMSAIARLLTIKSQHNQPESCYNDTLQLIHELLPNNSSLPKDFYRSKKLLEGLGMPYHKIHVCPKNCMLYYKDNKNKQKCDFCKTPRYKAGSKKIPRKVLRHLPIKDRLQRLFAHEETAKMLRSHKETPGKMVHPRDGEAWQQLDKDYPDFALDPRNQRVVVSTDGFTPYSLSAASYSCWPVFVVPLNLPPEVINRSEYIFLALVIPGPEHPGAKLNVLMQPLVDELTELWGGVQTWDAYGKENFPMKAAYLWSVHDFPAFGMVAGWSTHGKFCCYDCMSDTKAFRLENGGKACWFDCHRRFLPIGHEFRTQADAFRKDTIILDEPPKLMHFGDGRII